MAGMSTRAWVCTLIALVMPNAAYASGLTAAAMFEKCESVAVVQRGAQPVADQGVVSFLQHSQNSIYCLEYFDGFLDGWRQRSEVSTLRAMESMSDEELAELGPALRRVVSSSCSPAEGIAVGRAVETFMSFLLLHPELEGDTARTVFVTAMTDAYPCPDPVRSPPQ